MMKNIFLTIFIVGSVSIFAQVAIGKQSITNDAVSLEFGDYAVTNQARGIILPWVNSASDIVSKGAVPGTFVFDSNDKIVKYLKNGNQWINLSVNTTATIASVVVDTTGKADTTLQNSETEKASARVLIGGNPTIDTTEGILILADNNKAMILPKVPSPHLKIVNPEPGILVYDTDTKQLAVFNGTVWSFWESE